MAGAETLCERVAMLLGGVVTGREPSGADRYWVGLTTLSVRTARGNPG
jgi:hypothetical protein